MDNSSRRWAYELDSHSYNFLCDDCPINTESPANAVLAAARVDLREAKGNTIGRPNTDLGVIINACRRMRSSGECSDESALVGMAGEVGIVTQNEAPLMRIYDQEVALSNSGELFDPLEEQQERFISLTNSESDGQLEAIPKRNR